VASNPNFWEADKVVDEGNFWEADPLDQEFEEKRTFGEAASDLGVSFASGAGAMVENLGRIGALVQGKDENVATRHGGRAREFWDERKSEGLKARERRRTESIEGAEGIVGKAVAAAGETLLDPALLSSWLAEQVPMLVPSAGAGRVAGAGAAALGASSKVAGRTALGTAIGTGAAQQGADVGGDAYEGLMEMSPDLWAKNGAYQALVQEGLDDNAARHAVAIELSRDAALKGALVSAATNAIPGALVLERALVGAKIPAAGKLRAMVIGAFGETAQEMTEEGTGRAIANLARGQIDPSVPVSEGVGEAIGMAAPAGLFGAAGGLAAPARPNVPPPPPSEPPPGQQAGAAPSAPPGQPTMGDLVTQKLKELGVEFRTPVEVQPTFERKPEYPGGIDFVPPPAGAQPTAEDAFVAGAPTPSRYPGGIDYVPPGARPPAPLDAELEAVIAADPVVEQAPAPAPMEPGIPYGEGAPGRLGVETRVEGEPVSRTEPEAPPLLSSPTIEGEKINTPVPEVAPVKGEPAAPPASPRDRYYQEQVDTKRGDILSAIAKKGGLDLDESVGFGVDPAERNRRGWKIAPVFKANGKGQSWDAMAEVLAEQGWPTVDEKGNPDPNVLAELVHDALLGKKVAHPAADVDMDAAFEAFTAGDTYLEAEEYAGLQDGDRVLMDATEWAEDAGLDRDTIDEIIERGAMQDRTDAEIAEELRDAAQRIRAEGAEAAPAEPGERAQAQAPEAFVLAAQSEADVAEQERSRADTARARALDEERTKADAERDRFSLTGSDREADLAAAAGQQDLLAAAPPKSPPALPKSPPAPPAPTPPTARDKLRAKRPAKALSAIQLKERAQDEEGNVYEITRSAEEVLGEHDQRLKALNTLLDCLAS